MVRAALITTTILLCGVPRIALAAGPFSKLKIGDSIDLPKYCSEILKQTSLKFSDDLIQPVPLFPEIFYLKTEPSIEHFSNQLRPSILFANSLKTYHQRLILINQIAGHPVTTFDGVVIDKSGSPISNFILKAAKSNDSIIESTKAISYVFSDPALLSSGLLKDWKVWKEPTDSKVLVTKQELEQLKDSTIWLKQVSRIFGLGENRPVQIFYHLEKGGEPLTASGVELIQNVITQSTYNSTAVLAVWVFQDGLLFKINRDGLKRYDYRR